MAIGIDPVRDRLGCPTPALSRVAVIATATVSFASSYRHFDEILIRHAGCICTANGVRRIASFSSPWRRKIAALSLDAVRPIGASQRSIDEVPQRGTASDVHPHAPLSVVAAVLRR